jgi:hypothetical protein
MLIQSVINFNCIFIPFIVFLILYQHLDNSLLSYYLILQSCIFPFTILEYSKINIPCFVLVIISGLLKKSNNTYLIIATNLYVYWYLFLFLYLIIEFILEVYNIKNYLTYK